MLSYFCAFFLLLLTKMNQTTFSHSPILSHKGLDDDGQLVFYDVEVAWHGCKQKKCKVSNQVNSTTKIVMSKSCLQEIFMFQAPN